MAEYIDREDVREMMRMEFDDEYADEAVDRLPAAKVEPVRHGEWTKSEDDWNSLTTITCSECHEEWCFETEEDVSLLNYRYRPNCGAQMDLGGADNG